MGALLIGGIVAVACGVVLLLPFLRLRPGEVSPGPAPNAIQEFRRQRESLYQEIRLLHQDYNVGVISGAHYREGLQAYRRQAAGLLMDEERLKRAAGELEREILALRTTVASARDITSCPDCLRPVAADVADCPQCGASLPVAPPG